MEKFSAGINLEAVRGEEVNCAEPDEEDEEPVEGDVESFIGFGGGEVEVECSVC